MTLVTSAVDVDAAAVSSNDDVDEGDNGAVAVGLSLIECVVAADGIAVDHAVVASFAFEHVASGDIAVAAHQLVPHSHSETSSIPKQQMQEAQIWSWSCCYQLILSGGMLHQQLVWKGLS